MRTLTRNKRPIWQVDYLGEVDRLDENGLYTGEVKKAYSEPKKIFLNLYSSTSEIIEQMFGTTNNINIICSDEDVELKIGTKLFYQEPDENINYDVDFDLEVSAISESLNHYNYGFRSRK